MTTDDEIGELVSQVFDDEVENQYSAARLNSLGALLEQASLFLETAQFQTDNLELYKDYTEGAFYLYLIIPNSVQFQLNNKEYSRYLLIKDQYLKIAAKDSACSKILHLVQEKSEATYFADVVERTNSQLDVGNTFRKKAYSFSTIEPHPNENDGHTDTYLAQGKDNDEAHHKSTNGKHLSYGSDEVKLTIPIEEEIKVNHHGNYLMPTIPKTDTERESLSICGIRNLGNTCYMNGMLQCLFGTRIFRDLFVSGKYEIFKSDNEKLNDSPSVCDNLSLLFKKMYLNGGCCIIPTSFMEACKELRPDFKMPTYQQDTQEFLMYILDRLQMELSNTECTFEEYPSLRDHFANPKIDSSEYKEWCKNSLKNNQMSPIDYLFRGEIENMLQCRKCQTSSFSYSSFYILSLNIPKSSSHILSINKKVVLEDCINLFTRDEILEGENAWTCPNCKNLKETDPNFMVDTSFEEDLIEKIEAMEETFSKEKRKSHFFKLPKSIFDLNGKKVEHDHMKKYKKYENHQDSDSKSRSTPKNDNHKSEKISSQNHSLKNPSTLLSINFITLPPILIIHLSRFYYDITKKNETVISYHMNLNIVQKDETVVHYRLFGVINHNGNPKGGHYTSMVNMAEDHSNYPKSQRWVEYDDEIIDMIYEKYQRKKELNEISSNEAYVLFYERV